MRVRAHVPARAGSLAACLVLLAGCGAQSGPLSRTSSARLRHDLALIRSAIGAGQRQSALARITSLGGDITHLKTTGQLAAVDAAVLSRDANQLHRTLAARRSAATPTTARTTTTTTATTPTTSGPTIATTPPLRTASIPAGPGPGAPNPNQHPHGAGNDQGPAGGPGPDHGDGHGHGHGWGILRAILGGGHHGPGSDGGD